MSLLQLPDLDDVSWARLLEGQGEGGSYAYQIDASGADIHNRMMHRELMPNGGAPAMKTRIRLKSTLQANNPAFEGLAVRHRGYRLSGNVPASVDTRVWDSNPSASGVKAWYSEQSSTYTDAVFIEEIPPDLGIDYVTFELLVRAHGGQVTISNIECRAHYAINYNLSTYGFQQWIPALGIGSAFSVTSIPDPLSRFPNSAINLYARYLKTVNARVREGQLMSFELRGSVRSSAYYQDEIDGTSFKLSSESGVLVRLRIVGTGTYDNYIIAKHDDESIAYEHLKNPTIEGSHQMRAENSYDQAELIIFCDPGYRAGAAVIGITAMSINDMIVNMVVADYISPTQQ